MNRVGKLAWMRIIVLVLMVVVMLFPFYQLGVVIPTFLVNGKVLVDIRYIITGILFAIVILFDILNGSVLKKKSVTKWDLLVDDIVTKLGVDLSLIMLACDNMVMPLIPIVVVARDIVVGPIEVVVGGNRNELGVAMMEKVKLIFLLMGIVFTFFYNMPFEFLNVRVADFLLIVAMVMTVVTGYRYGKVAKRINWN